MLWYKMAEVQFCRWLGSSSSAGLHANHITDAYLMLHDVCIEMLITTTGYYRDL